MKLSVAILFIIQHHLKAGSDIFPLNILSLAFGKKIRDVRNKGNIYFTYFRGLFSHIRFVDIETQ